MYLIIGWMETLKLRLSTQGRAGKAVTGISGFTRDARQMERLASDLKRRMACGGTWRQGVIELQGDVRDRVRPVLAALGYTVKG